jgi:uncharacterized protein YukE
VTFGSAASQLQHAIKTLRARWDAVEGEWRDDVRRQFEQTRLDPLDRQAEDTLRAMRELIEIMHRIHSDCSDAEDA